ncbi:MAG: hypothetical protein MRERV_20c034 [Mycoplasmataceae bacterium RV_VA103A]|nr:MAG: hypothetical protein MRERV_20c034 [Mycoplasmataceae bacterium RV_VA103A]
MKLIYIKSTMEPKNYAALRSLLKKEQGEKIAPHVFKLANLQTLQKYLQQEKIKYETYQEISEQGKLTNKTELRQQLIAGYKANAKNKKLQKELGAWEKISTHDVLTQIAKNEGKKKHC